VGENKTISWKANAKMWMRRSFRNGTGMNVFKHSARSIMTKQQNACNKKLSGRALLVFLLNLLRRHHLVNILAFERRALLRTLRSQAAKP
jgi:hypothetical protein